MKYFDVRLRMPADLASKLMLEYSDYYNGCEEVKDEHPHHKKHSHYANGKRDKGIPGHALVMQVLADHLPHHRNELQEAFVAHSFSANSVYPQLSTMVRAQEIKRLGPDHYMLNTATSQAALDLQPVTP
jgi:hypothetical protein